MDTAGFILITIRTSRPTVTRPGTTRTQAHTGAAQPSTVRTAAQASARATTREPEPTRAARRLTVRTARAASRRPTTPGLEPMAPRDRARTSTAAGARPTCSAAMTGPRPTATRTIGPA